MQAGGFNTAAERCKRFLGKVSSTAAMSGDSGCSGDERIARVKLFQVFRVGTMIKLGSADDPGGSCNAK